MHVWKITQIILLVLFGIASSDAMATNNTDSSQSTIDTRFANQNSVVNQLFDIRAALLHYHNSYTAWPPVLTEISTGNAGRGTERTYAGRYDTPFGAAITGAASADQRFYVLTVDVGRGPVAEYISRRVGGTHAGTVVTMTLGTPTASAIVPNALLRINDPSDPTNDRNTMRTNLGMDGNSIFDLSDVQSDSVNAGTVNIATLLKVDGTSSFTGLARFDGGVTADRVESNELVVSGTSTFNGASNFNDAVGFNKGVTFVDGVTFKQDALFERNISVDQVTANDGQFSTLTASGNATLKSDVNVNGTLNAQQINGTTQTLTGSQTVDSQTVKNNQVILGSQTISGGSTVRGNSVVEGTQTVRDLVVTNTATVSGITNLGQMQVADDVTLYKYLWFSDGQKTGLSKGQDDSLRVHTKSAYLDIGNYSAGWINVDTNLDGVEFADAVKAPKVSVLGSGNTEVEIRSVDGASPMLVFGNDSVVDDITMQLTGDDQLSLIGGRLNLTAGLDVAGTVTINDGSRLSIIPNESWAHFYAEKPFYFNQNVHVNGMLRIHDSQTFMTKDYISENGVRLDAKYLGINAKAVDSDKLDGIDSSQFARRDIASNFTQDQTFDQNVTVSGRIYANNGVHIKNEWLRIDGQSGLYFETYGGGWHMTDSTWLRAYNNKSVYTGGVLQADGGITVLNGRRIASADGNVLYEGGTPLSSKYLGISSKAVDADKIDGLDSSQLARRDVNPNFASDVTVSGQLIANSRIHANNGVHIKNDWLRIDGQNGVYFETYGGGWNMTDATWIRAYNDKSIYSAAVLRGDGGIQVDGKWIASHDGNHLYENNVPLSSKYLGISAKASDSNLLDGYDSSAFVKNQSGAAGELTKLLTLNDATIDGSAGSDHYPGLSIGQNTPQTDAYMSFHVHGDYAVNFGLDGSTNKLSVGGWSMGGNSFPIYHEGYKPSAQDVGIGNRLNWHSTSNSYNSVVGQLGWKNYGNNHTIFDASAATSPDGTSVDRSNAQIAWSPTYPTLMGWNGTYTYGVRVDSARVSDNASNSQLLDGIDSTQFARRDLDPLFNSNVSVNGRVYAKNGVHVQGDWLRVDGQSGLYFETYGGGWHMTDSTWLRAYNNKDIYTAGVLRADNGLQVDGKWIASSDGNYLYENGVSLGSKYLGISSKAVDADRIDGLDSSQLARRDANNTLSGTNTFNGSVYYQGTELDSRYYNTGEKVGDADSVDGIDGSSIARRDANNTMSGTNTFNSSVYYQGTELDSRYYNAGEKVGDADSVDGIDGSSIARRDANNTLTGTNTFTGNVSYKGTELDSRYYNIGEKVGDANSLDGIDSWQFARSDTSNTFGSSQTFLAPITINSSGVRLSIGATNSSATHFYSDRLFYFNNDMRVNGTVGVYGSNTYLTSDHIMENGTRLDNKYLGISSKAVDSDKLDGIDGSLFARRDVDNTFGGTNTFSSRMYADNGLHVRNDWLRVDGQSGVYFQSYGGGWHMNDSTWLRAYGNKSIYTSGVLQADGGIKVDGKSITSSDGSVLYENGQALNQRYLGINAKASDANKLDGLDSSQFARTDVDERFDRSITVAGGVKTNTISNTSNQWVLRSSSDRTSLYYGGVERLLVNSSGSTVNGNMTITGSLFVNGKNIVGTLNDHEDRITVLENRGQKTAQQMLDEICTTNNKTLVQRSGVWRCEDVVVDTNTNAATLCSAGQYLDGDGSCKTVPVFDVKMTSYSWTGTMTSISRNLGCPAGYTTVVACSGGVVTPGNSSSQDNESHRVYASGNRCYITGDSEGNTTVTLNTTCKL